MSETNDYRDEMREKSNFDLQEIAGAYPNEEKERVIAALRELDRRDVLYSDNRKLLEDLEEEIPDSKNFDQPQIQPSLLNMLKDPNIVDDITAPKLYSRFAIRFFAIIFSTLFGGILLSINLSRLGKKSERYYVIGFSALFSYLVFYATTRSPENATTITFLLNIAGAFILEELFWKRYIGKHFKFRKQPIAGALMIGFGISLLLLYTMVSA